MPVERTAGGTSLIDVLDRVLDKGIVIDAWVRVSLVGIDLITVEARVVVASIDTYLKYSEAVGTGRSPSRAPDRRRPLARGGDGRERRPCARSSPRRSETAAVRRPAAAASAETVSERNGGGTVEVPEGTASARRGPAPARPHAADELADAKLALLEFLLACDDLREVARRGRSSGCSSSAASARAACFSVELDGNRMVAAGRTRVRRSRTRRAGLVDRSRRPRAPARGRRRAGACRPRSTGRFARPRLAALLGRTPLHGVPLQGRHGRDEWTSGLLVLDPGTTRPSPPRTWLVPRARPSPADRRAACRLGAEPDKKRRARARCCSTRCPTRSCSPTPRAGCSSPTPARERCSRPAEDESEGRRRAVALNNMLFSSALAQRAIAGRAGRRELLLVDPVDGSDLLFELLSTAVTDPREGTGIVSILRNVTDLRRATEEIEENYRKLRLAEADVRAERDRLDLIIDSVADPILVTDSAGGARAHERAGRAALHRAARRAAATRPQRVRANDAHFSSFVSNLFFVGEAAAATRRARPRRPRDRARRCRWRRSRARSSPSTARSRRSSPSSTTAPRQIEKRAPLRGAEEGVRAARGEGARGDRRAGAARTSCCAGSASSSSRPRRSSRSSSPTCRTSSARR